MVLKVKLPQKSKLQNLNKSIIKDKNRGEHV